MAIYTVLFEMLEIFEILNMFKNNRWINVYYIKSNHF